MNTDAVICIAFTRQRPSHTPLIRTHSSTSGVMLTNPRRAGTLNQSSLRNDFICHKPLPRRTHSNHEGVTKEFKFLHSSLLSGQIDYVLLCEFYCPDRLQPNRSAGH